MTNQELIARLFTDAGMTKMDMNNDYADQEAELLIEAGKALLEAESENQRLRGHLASLQRLVDKFMAGEEKAS